MHLENVLFHLLNVLLLFAVARRYAPEQEGRPPLLALTAALLFALHPINAEAVNWISGRSDLIACFFVLLSAFLLRQPTAGFASGFAATVLAALSLLTA